MCMQGGAEREERENPKKAPCCAVSTKPDAGLTPVNHEIMT